MKQRKTYLRIRDEVMKTMVEDKGVIREIGFTRKIIKTKWNVKDQDPTQNERIE
jgi:hypothetical protein